jgi:hypothetical protein
MNTAITIYSREYTHQGHAFSVWSYLDDPDPKRSTLLFAYRAAGVTRVGLPDRKAALRQARRHLDALPPPLPDPPDEKTAVDEAPLAGQGELFP